MRTFERGEGTSHKFWNIALSGIELTIITGRVGTAGRAQTQTFPNPGAASREHDRLIAEQVGKGWKETTAPPPREVSPACQALQSALVENPDDLASHMAYADYLTEQGDPLGDFVRTQLALEDPGVATAD